ncbi:MAG TPA: hypothetical protein VLA98_05390 [Solirubrobacteraceae bacterium]|nr:hypothetical protein [Solirubrobacteraceae bacterium]
MAEILRLADADEASLRARVARIVRQHGGECAVDHFVVWYTTRPPVHAAIIFVHA